VSSATLAQTSINSPDGIAGVIGTALPGAPRQFANRTVERFKLEVTLMDVQFVASVAPIVRDADAARAFYHDALGLTFEGGGEGDYAYTHRLEGTKHFGLWPLAEAANACFGSSEWPAEIPVPQASIEFEVLDVGDAAKELRSKKYRLIHDARTEPWGQITARLLSPEGLLVAVCYTPAFHERP
jgi:catechol 2,3-dioxygenase-like lactoylglutathione lyase family enzyme